MKKALAFLLALTLLLALAACGQSTTEETTAETPAEAAEETAAEETAVAEEPEEAEAPAFEPVTLVDNDDAVVIVTAFDPEGVEDITGPAFTVSMENRTDQELEFVVRGNVNDVGLYSGAYATIPAGETDEQYLYWRADLFAAYGLNYVESVAVTTQVFESNSTGYYDDDGTWTYDYMVDEELTLTVPAPADAEGPAVGEPVSAIDFEPVALIDADGIRLTAIDYLLDSSILLLRAENDSDETLYMYSQGLIVNGRVQSYGLLYDLNPGEQLFTLSIPTSDFDINGIQYVELLEGTISIYDTQDAVWSGEGDPIVEETFTLDIPAPEDADGPATVEPEFDFDEVVLVDTEDYTLVLKDYDRDGEMSSSGLYAVMYMENRSDKTISVSFDSLTVNGLTIEGPYLGQLEPGRAQYDWVPLVYSENAERYGINYLETVSGTLYGFFPYSLVETEWGETMETAFENAPFSFELPAPENADGPALTEPEFDFDEVVVAEGDGYTISIKDFGQPDGYSSPVVLFYYETGDVEGMYFAVEDVVVDGTSYEVYTGTPNLPSNARGYCSVYLWGTPTDGSEYVLNMNIGFPADWERGYSTTVTLTLD